MCLARTWTSYKHDVLRLVHEVPSMELAYQCFVDFAVLELEAGQVAVAWQARLLELVGHRPNLAFSHFSLEQLGQHRLRCL